MAIHHVDETCLSKWRLGLAAKMLQPSQSVLISNRSSAWLMLGFVEAASRNNILLDERELQWLDKNGFFKLLQYEYALNANNYRK